MPHCASYKEIDSLPASLLSSPRNLRSHQLQTATRSDGCLICAVNRSVNYMISNASCKCARYSTAISNQGCCCNYFTLSAFKVAAARSDYATCLMLRQSRIEAFCFYISAHFIIAHQLQAHVTWLSRASVNIQSVLMEIPCWARGNACMCATAWATSLVCRHSYWKCLSLALTARRRLASRSLREATIMIYLYVLLDENWAWQYQFMFTAKSCY